MSSRDAPEMGVAVRVFTEEEDACAVESIRFRMNK